jgi:Family of unknown function (DUF6011)
MTKVYEGPHIETKRYQVRGSEFYVELRQTNGYGYPLGYVVEHGDKYGHRGSWGRDNYQAARAAANEAFTYELGQLAAKSQPVAGRFEVTPVPEQLVARRLRPEITEGFWSLGGDQDIYKVQAAVHGSGHLYAKRLMVDDYNNKVSWVYVPGAISRLRDGNAHPLTKDEAVRFGKLYGVCCICGRTLTNETSIEAGIGPVCSGRQGW